MANDLENLRQELDACGTVLLQLLAGKAIYDGPADEKDKRSAFLVRIYHLLAPGLHDKKLARHFTGLQAGDTAVQRIMTGSDFSGNQLSKLEYHMLKSYIDIDDERIVSLLRQRCRLIEQVAAYKKEYKIAIRHQEREQELVAVAENQCARYALPEKLGLVLYERLLFPLAFEIEGKIISGYQLFE